MLPEIGDGLLLSPWNKLNKAPAHKVLAHANSILADNDR